jgi:hypothetical protein
VYHVLSSDGEWSIFGSDSEESQSVKKTSWASLCPEPAVAESFALWASKQLCANPQVNSSRSFNSISLRRTALNKCPWLIPRSPTPNTDHATV